MFNRHHGTIMIDAPHSRGLLLVFLLGILGHGPAQAVTYSYLGNTFDFSIPPYTNSDRVSGSFTVAAPLAPNSMVNVAPLLQSFSFSDGQATRDESNTTVCQFTADTDGSGAITGWSVWLREAAVAPGGFQHNLETWSAYFDQGGFSIIPDTTGCGGLALDPIGSTSGASPANAWTISGLPMPVPTLSTLGLAFTALSLSLLGFLGTRRGRNRRG